MPAKFLATRDIGLADLERFPGNARRGDVKQIARSLYRNGQYRSLVVRQHDGHLTILAGNHTRDALELLYGGWLPPGVHPPGRWAGQRETARCELIECDDAEALRINVADNRTGELPDPETGERYDGKALADLLAALDGDLDGSGWEPEDITAIVEDDDDEAGEDEYGDGDGGATGDPGRGELLALAGVTVGEPRHKPEPGQIWALAGHRLVIADVFAGWPLWAPLLEGDAVFLPYPTPLAPHAPAAGRLVMVQPETFLAGHLLDKWESITGSAPVVVNEQAAAA